MAAVLFLIVFQAAYGRSIPGIDPGEMAVDPEKKGEVTEPERISDGAPPAEAEPASPPAAVVGKSVVTGLKGEKMASDPYSVHLQWEVDPRNESPLFIARSKVQLFNHNRVLDAYNLTSPPLPADRTQFDDINIPDGEYFYAVISQAELRKRSSMPLGPDQNYSTKSIVIKREISPEQVVTADLDRYREQRVKNLNAENLENAVKLTWERPETTDPIEFNVYRSKSPLDTDERIKKADKLAALPGDTLEYLDNAPIFSDEIYYGVTVMNKALNKEITGLKLNKSYIAHAFTKLEESKEYSKYFPGALISTQVSSSGIKLFWVEPEKEYAELKLYRAQHPIFSFEKLNQAQMVAKIEKGKSFYEDGNLEAGNYYYALMPVLSSGRELTAFFEDRTFTGNPVTLGGGVFEPKKEPVKVEEAKKPEEPVKPETIAKPEEPVKPEIKQEEKPPVVQHPPETIPEKKPPKRIAPEKPVMVEPAPGKIIAVPEIPKKGELPVVQYFQVLPIRGGAHLYWRTDRLDPEIRYLLYRSGVLLDTISKVRRSGVFIQEIPHSVEQYEDRNLAPGKYYYAIIVERGGYQDKEMHPGKNYIPFPVIVSDGEKQGRIEKDKKPPRVDRPEISTEPERVTTPTTQEPAQTIQTPEPGVSEEGKPPIFKDDDLRANMDRLNRILAATFTKNRYIEAVQELEPFIADEEVPPRVRARAMFYAGMANFNLKRYEEAMRYFADGLLIAEYPDRANFWYRRTLEKLK